MSATDRFFCEYCGKSDHITPHHPTDSHSSKLRTSQGVAYDEMRKRAMEAEAKVAEQALEIEALREIAEAAQNVWERGKFPGQESLPSWERLATVLATLETEDAT